MGAYPQMVRDITSLKEEADLLEAHTKRHIAPDKLPEFERKLAPVKNLRENILSEDTGQGLDITSALSDHITGAITLGKKHGGRAFYRATPMWRQLRDKCEVVDRRFRLFNFWSEEDMKPSLWWMSQCGGPTDLHLLLQLKKNVPEDYRQVSPLIDLAIEQISSRSAECIAEVCRFFSLDDEFESAETLLRELISGRLSFETVRQIEDLQAIKEVIEEQGEMGEYMDFINTKIRRIYAIYPHSHIKDKVKQLVEQLRQVEASAAATEDEAGAQDEEPPESESPRAEAYAVAQIKDHKEGESFWLGETYVVQGGVQNTIPEGFEGEAVEVPEGDGPLDFDLILYAEDMLIEPDWKQTYRFDRKGETPLIEFRLTPQKAGEKVIRVEFLYQLHWIATIRFEVTVAERRP